MLAERLLKKYIWFSSSNWQVFEKEEFVFESMESKSGIADQPFGEEETRKGLLKDDWVYF